jgi:hypothetical protein
MKFATHCTAAFVALSSLASTAFGFGNGPNYDPAKNMLFPGSAKSQGLYAVINNGGEFGVSARATKKKGKLKKVRDIEMNIPGVEGLSRLKAVGNGSLVKMSSTRVKDVMNAIPSADGQSMQVFFRNKKGKVISNKAQVGIGGQFWFDTFGSIKNLEKQIKSAGAINPEYQGPTGGRTRGMSSSGYVQLDAALLNPIKEIAIAHLKALVMAYDAFNQSVESLGLEDHPLLPVYGGFSTIANGIVSSLLTTDPNFFQSLSDQLLSIDPEVLGFSEAGFATLVAKISASGSFDWTELVEVLRELIDIPVKKLTEDFQFVVEYTWPPDQSDLDTGTTFLGSTVGFSWASTATYMNWTGDDVTEGGSEIVAIDINGAAEAGALPSSFQITCAAGWYIPAGGSGPATLHVYLLNQRTGQRFGEVTREITPGAQNGAATTPVGSATFSYSPDTNVLQFAID